MNLSGLVDAVARNPAVATVGELAARGTGTVVEATAALHPILVAQIARSRAAGATVLVVTATGREAEDVAAVLPDLLPDVQAAVFPSWETLPHERLSPSLDTVGRRVAVLHRLAHPEDDGTSPPLDVVATSVRALLQIGRAHV